MTTFSTALKLELPGDGQQTGTWGQTTNKNLGTLLEQAITGVDNITMVDANYTLSTLNGTSDEARNAVIIVGGINTTVRDVIVPTSNKVYTIQNNTTGGFAIRVITAAGTGVTIPSGMITQVYCNGTNVLDLQNGVPDSFVVSGNLGVGGTTALTGVTTITGNLNGTTATFSGAISSVSPAFTGTPTAPTATAGTNTTQIATTAFVTTATGTLGTMSTQNANNVAITGGTITGTTINTYAVGSNATGQKTVSTGSPTGGSDGDIWYKI
jgi:hypothetical protein